MCIDINMKATRKALFRASKKQTALLFRALLDYAEYGRQPSRDPEEPYSEWLLRVFPEVIESAEE